MRIGVLGTGTIANTVLKTLVRMPEVEGLAIASRSLERANLIKESFNLDKAYGSYMDMLLDPWIDLVYIATPEAFHYRELLSAIDNGKPVVCEKAFCINADQARDVFSRAKQNGIFITEACWTLFTPLAHDLKRILREQTLGPVHDMLLSVGDPLWDKVRDRGFQEGRGALLDVGIYPIYLSYLAMGMPERVMVQGDIDPEAKIDRSESITLVYEGGRTCHILSSIDRTTNRNGLIVCRNGYIEVDKLVNYLQLRLYDSSRKLIDTLDAKNSITGYEYQFMAAKEAIKLGKLETTDAPWSQTVDVLGILDDIRAAMGLRYPSEES